MLTSDDEQHLHLEQRTEADEPVVAAKQCVLATGAPILDRGGFFARLKPQRSYCTAFTVPTPPPRAMYLSADSPSRSVRYAPTRDGERVIVGGNGHVVGRGAEAAAVADLVAWTKLHFPGAELTHVWSAQDYEPVHELPFVGPLLPRSESLFVATGFAKWGMTNGVAAALLLAKRLLGGTTGPVGSGLPELDGKRAIRTVPRIENERGSGRALGLGVDYPGGALPGAGTRRRRGGGGTAVADDCAQRRRRGGALRFPGLHTSRWHCRVERRGEVLGLSVTRIALRLRRHRFGGTCHPPPVAPTPASAL